MRVLLTGATGLLGGAIGAELLRQGHELVCAVRDPARLHLQGPRCMSLRADLAKVPAASWWQPHLAGIDAVVNAVGILREQGGQRFRSLHTDAPAELFRACAAAGVRCVVQVSALGADEQARSGYHRSKKAADDVLRGLGLAGAIVQPSLVHAPQGASASLFLTLAAAPVLLLPRRGEMEVQPVHLDDVVDGVLAVLKAPQPGTPAIAFVGERPLALRDYLRQLRGQLGYARPQRIGPLPPSWFLAGAGIAGRLPGSLLDAETAGMLLRGNSAPAAAMAGLLGRLPRPVSAFVSREQAPLLRTAAVLGLWLPVLRLALAALWIWTGLVSLGLYPVQDSYELLARVGLHGVPATVALHGAALLDIALGLLTLFAPARWRPRVWAGQLLLIGGYTALITLFLPEYWLHPYGPLSKNLPILAAIGLLWALEPPRRH